MNAKLELSDGTMIYGKSVGHEVDIAGEVIFNTAMTGHVEALTDPAYHRQILVFTYPLIGNYGVPKIDTTSSSFFESDRIHVKAIIASSITDQYSHHLANESLASWLKREKIVALEGIDTRMLTKKLRNTGVMTGKILFENSSNDVLTPMSNEVSNVTCKEVITYGSGKYKIVLIDCGVTESVLNYFLSHDTTVIRVPFDYDYHQTSHDGLFISNGPGNPEKCIKTIELIRKSLTKKIPILATGLGHQILALASGAKIIKLKYGHHGHNQPVKTVGSNKCFLTSQNHGYTIDSNSLPKDWVTSFVNLNDGTNEGIMHRSRPFFATQFCPEITSRQGDTDFLFEGFFQMMGRI